MLHIKSEKLREDLVSARGQSKYLFWKTCSGKSIYMCTAYPIDSLKNFSKDNSLDCKELPEYFGESLSMALKTNKYAFAKCCSISDRYIGFVMAEKNNYLDFDRETAEILMMTYPKFRATLKYDWPIFASIVIFAPVYILAIFITPPLPLPLVVCVWLAILAYAALEYFYVSRIAVPNLLAEYSDKTDDLPSIREFLKEDPIVEDTFSSSKPALSIEESPPTELNAQQSL